MVEANYVENKITDLKLNAGDDNHKKRHSFIASQETMSSFCVLIGKFNRYAFRMLYIYIYGISICAENSSYDLIKSNHVCHLK